MATASTSAPRERSVARRVTLMAVALVAAVLVLVGVALAVLNERSARQQLVQSVGTTVQAVAQSLDAADNTNREMAHGTMKGFQRYFEATMQLDEGTGELRSYGGLVNGDYGSVDKFASETGGVAAVYARKGEDFATVTTSVKNADGQRALDVALARTDPAWAAAAKGEPYTGLVGIQAVGQLDQMTQQNAALVEQSAAAALSLREQADRLAAAVQVFKLDGASPDGAARALSRPRHGATGGSPVPLALQGS